MDEEDLNIEEQQMTSLEDNDEMSDEKSGSIAQYVMDRYNRASTAREVEERRWLKAYRNYRGLYGPDTQFSKAEKSQVFIKVTKTKVLAAYGQVCDVLFGNNKFPLGINPTVLPDGVEDTVHFESNPQVPGEVKQQLDEGQELKPGETWEEYTRRLGGLDKLLTPVKDEIRTGPSNSPSGMNFFPAEVAAKKMEKKIHDQLDESKAKKHLRSAAFELCLFGTGIMKGPFVETKEYPRWTPGEVEGEATYDPIIKDVPKVDHVSLWNFYPDPDAHFMEEAEYVVEVHQLSKSQLRNLKKRPFFRDEEVEIAIEIGPQYHKEYFEQAMEDDSIEVSPERFKVHEYWGYVDRQTLEDNKVDKALLKELGDSDQVSMNVWVCNGRVLRLILNPFTPSIIPYYVTPYEMNPYSMWGIGVAENMDDSQTLMNGFMRMAVDNQALSGNLILEIDRANLANPNDMELYPGKIFERADGAPGQAVFATQFPNVSAQNLQLYQTARQQADESTGFPSFAHGQTGVQGVGRTASGISMLMGAAQGGIKTVIKNVDDYLLGPLGKALFSYNMQYDFDPEIQGDLEVRAEGTESLMANEVRSQRLMQFLGVVQNQILAPFANMDYIVRELAKSLDLDPDKVTNSMAKAAIQAKLIQQYSEAMAPPQPQPGPDAGPGGPPPGAQAGDTQGSGGGTMGTGTAPGPQEPGFSGNTGEGGMM